LTVTRPSTIHRSISRLEPSPLFSELDDIEDGLKTNFSDLVLKYQETEEEGQAEEEEGAAESQDGLETRE
jgi:hypothetical protein